MKGLRTISAIGMPYHGLATDGALSTTLDGTKTIVEPAALVGVCIPVVHPSAPGATRNTAQLARDSAHGFDWRNYALLCGDNHAVNGSPDAELGVDSWLYCDSAGATWVIRVEAIDDGSTMTVNVWLDAIFGRFGKPRTFTAQLLDSMTWAPEIPSWYGGGYTAAHVIDVVNFQLPYAVAPIPDGSQCYINVFAYDETISDAVYRETQPISNGSTFQSYSLISVWKIDISGAGDLDDNGDGITATIVEDLGYETDLVVFRGATGTSGDPYFIPCTYAVTESNDPPAYPGDNCSPPTLESYVQDFDIDANHATSGTYYEYSGDHQVILYKNADGVVTRNYQNVVQTDWTTTEGGGWSRTWDLSTCGDATYSSVGFGGWHYDPTCTDGGGYSTWQAVTQTITTTRSAAYSVFGETYTNYTQTVRETVTTDNCATGSLCVGGSTGTDPGRPSESDDTTYYVNGVELDVGGGVPDLAVYHEYRPLAPNLHYVTHDYAISTSTRNHDENVVAINSSGVASEVYDDTTTHAPLGTTRKIPDLRELVWSWQPVTEASTHGAATLAVFYSGSRYQYC